MRIAVIGPCYPYRGGIAHHTARLVEALRDDHEVLFISYRRQYPEFAYPGQSDKESGPAPSHLPEVIYLLDSMDPRSWWRTSRKVAEAGVDLVIFPWWVVFWAPQIWVIAGAIKRRCHTKIVFLCHNVHEHEPSWLKRLLTRAVLRRGDRYVVQSKQEAEKLVKMIPGATFSVVHHPVYDDLTTERMAKEEARDSLGITGPVVLFFGFVRPYKGLDVLLHAMVQVRKTVGARLLVVGEFWKTSETFHQQVRRLQLEDAVTLVDRYVSSDELPIYFGAADVVALPYRSASGSGVAQLALGMSRPLVVSDVGALADVVEDGVSGRVVPAEDPEALAGAITNVLDPDHLANYTRAAADRGRLFSWDNLARAVVTE